MRRKSLGRAAIVCSMVVGLGAIPALAAAAPTVTVPVVTSSLTFPAHESLTIPVGCSSGTLVGGGSYLRNATNPATVPNNGLVLDGTLPSNSLGAALASGTTNPSNWTTVAGFSGQSELGDESETFALCETSGAPSGTILETASTTGTNATQEVSVPTVTTASCPSGDHLLSGGAVESTPGQVNDGGTVSNNGNLKPMASYPSNSTGVMAANGSTSATSWSTYGSAGMTASTDTVTAFALCATGATQPTVTVERSNTTGPAGQAGSTVTSATVACVANTQLIGGGFEVDETVSGTSGLQPQQGYHMRGSYPSNSSGTEVSNGATDPSDWTIVQQAGGQTLGSSNEMNTHTFALCSS
jgi:hypothetical protein